ncbi:DUF2970 domain-containing protein [Pseudohaliea sp.]|uniref:DUF2970 domain-containing protein n=1 Tax=Pseudohaliea sp. TaxID=2740289 RepID=UPI0032EC1431
MEDRNHSAAKDEAAAGQDAPGQDNGDASTGAQEPAPDREERKGLGVLQVVSSVFAAGLGVQSSRNRERDFRQGRAGTFIAAGLIFTALFIGAVLTVVKLVLAGAD